MASFKSDIKAQRTKELKNTIYNPNYNNNEDMKTTVELDSLLI